VLEAEIDNLAALQLYENLGFIRDKRLHKYYLNGHDAFRLHLLLSWPLQCRSMPSLSVFWIFEQVVLEAEIDENLPKRLWAVTFLVFQ